MSRGDQKPALIAPVAYHQQINLEFHCIRIFTRNGYETNTVHKTALNELGQSYMVRYG